MPLWPRGRAANGEGMILPRLRRPVVSEAGGAWPAYFSSAGLGSKVSTCDGPPFMNRKITRLARAGKCGGRGASGLTGTDASASPAAPRPRRPEPLSSPASASTLPRPSAPKPPPIRQNKARRLIGRPGAMIPRPSRTDHHSLAWPVTSRFGFVAATSVDLIQDSNQSKQKNSIARPARAWA